MKQVHITDDETNDCTKTTILFVHILITIQHKTTWHNGTQFRDILQSDFAHLQKRLFGVNLTHPWTVCLLLYSRQSTCVYVSKSQTTPYCADCISSIYILAGENFRVSATCGIFPETFVFFPFCSPFSQTPIPTTRTQHNRGSRRKPMRGVICGDLFWATQFIFTKIRTRLYACTYGVLNAWLNFHRPLASSFMQVILWAYSG